MNVRLITSTHRAVTLFAMSCVASWLVLGISILEANDSPPQEPLVADATTALVFSDDFEREQLAPKAKSPFPDFRIDDGLLKGRQVEPNHGGTYQAVVKLPNGNAIVELKFRFAGARSFSLACDDRNFKGAHAGHIARIVVRADVVKMFDDKQGVMRPDIRKLLKSGDDKKIAEGKRLSADANREIPVQLKPQQWHKLRLQTIDDEMSVTIDGKHIGTLKSGGLAHSRKSDLGMSVWGSDRSQEVHFDELRVYSVVNETTNVGKADAAPIPPPIRDRFGGTTDLKSQASGWFRVEKLGPRWIFVTPEGHGFFSLGVTHAIDCVRKDELNLFQSRYESDEQQLSDFILQQFADWQFNSAGYGALLPMENRIPYVASIRTVGPRSLSGGNRSKNEDIFEQGVRNRLQESVRREAARHVSNRYCLGYVFIDLPIWSPTFGKRGRGSYVDFFRTLDADRAGKQEYIRFLLARYRDNPAEFRKHYGIDLPSEEALVKVDFTQLSADNNQTIVADDEAFLQNAADVYCRCVVDALRSVDPNHLILGDRFIAGSDKTPDSILKVAAKYIDVLSFQPLGSARPVGPYLDHVTKLTGKPVLLADVNTMTRRPLKEEPDLDEYQRSAGEHTKVFYQDAATRLGCIGIHRCTIRDYQPWNPRFHRRGLLKADDTPYAILVEQTRQANQQLYQLVYSSATDR